MLEIKYTLLIVLLVGMVLNGLSERFRNWFYEVAEVNKLNGEEKITLRIFSESMRTLSTLIIVLGLLSAMPVFPGLENMPPINRWWIVSGYNLMMAITCIYMVASIAQFSIVLLNSMLEIIFVLIPFKKFGSTKLYKIFRGTVEFIFMIAATLILSSGLNLFHLAISRIAST